MHDQSYVFASSGVAKVFDWSESNIWVQKPELSKKRIFLNK